MRMTIADMPEALGCRIAAEAGEILGLPLDRLRLWPTWRQPREGSSVACCRACRSAQL